MKNKHNSLILLPYDFSEVSNTALDHAIGLAKLFNYSIMILNIFDTGTKGYMRKIGIGKDDIIQKLNDIAANVKKEHDVEADFIFKKSNIGSIKKIAVDVGTTFMVLGFEKPRSRTTAIMKLLAKSPVPVLIIPEGMPWKKYEKIFFPLDNFSSSRQKAGIAKAIALACSSSIHIFSFIPEKKEDKYRQHKIIEQIQEFFLSNRVNYTLEISEAKTSDDFVKEGLSKYNTGNKDFDFLIVMQRPKKAFQTMHKTDKKLIFNNSSIPVMYVNLRDMFVGGGFH
jgi:hypothetical protein